METIIYVDIMFFINFVIDGLCITLTLSLLNKRFILWRFLCACTLGGVYSILTVAMPIASPIFAVVLHLTAAFVICLTAIKPKSFSKALLHTVYFFFANSLLGGLLYALYTLCGCFVMYNGAFYAEISATALMVSAVVTATVLLFCFAKYKAHSAASYCDVKIQFRGKHCRLSCIVDSGNLLVCPYTALPVIIINKNSASSLFTQEELNLLSLTPTMERVRPLPAKGIGGDVMLPSFLPERAELCPFGQKSFTEKDVCVAIQLSSDNFGGCDGVVPLSLI